MYGSYRRNKAGVPLFGPLCTVINEFPSYISARAYLIHMTHAPETGAIKPCPHCRRKVRLSPKTARQSAKFGDCRTFLRQSPFSATNCRTFLRQCGQALSQLHFSFAGFWHVCHVNLGPDSSGNRFRRRLEHCFDCSLSSQKALGVHATKKHYTK